MCYCRCLFSLYDLHFFIDKTPAVATLMLLFRGNYNLFLLLLRRFFNMYLKKIICIFNLCTIRVWCLLAVGLGNYILALFRPFQPRFFRRHYCFYQQGLLIPWGQWWAGILGNLVICWYKFPITFYAFFIWIFIFVWECRF